MKNAAFVIWMLGYPLTFTIDKFAPKFVDKVYSDGVITMAAITVMAIWIIVGGMLYEGKR